MFENLPRNPKIRMIRCFLTDTLRRARAIRDWYQELGYTETEMRGIKLLREWLSPEQLVQFHRFRYFDVTGCHSGKTYRYVTVRERISGNLTDLGYPKAGWCFVPNEPLVPGDVMLAQKISLETDEWTALAVAKSFRPI